MAIKHLSLDFWNTLATPNPAYSLLRSQIFAQAYGCTVEQAAENYRLYKNTLNYKLFLSTQYATPQDYIQQLDLAFEKVLPELEFVVLSKQLRTAFEQYPPTLCQQSIAILYKLRDWGLTCSITSNTTGIIPGRMLEPLLPEDLFQFCMWSNQLPYCKPQPAIFTELVRRLAPLDTTLELNEIMHVGDDRHCDVEASKACGLSTALVSKYGLSSTLDEIFNLSK